MATTLFPLSTPVVDDCPWSGTLLAAAQPSSPLLVPAPRVNRAVGREHQRVHRADRGSDEGSFRSTLRWRRRATGTGRNPSRCPS